VKLKQNGKRVIMLAHWAKQISVFKVKKILFQSQKNTFSKAKNTFSKSKNET